MKILFYLHHPAHFHLFKNVIDNLKENGHVINVLATNKDVLEELLIKRKIEHQFVLHEERKNYKLSMAIRLFKQDYNLLTFCLKNKPDLLVGTSVANTHVGRLLNIPSVFLNEDDITVVPIVGRLAYPFTNVIVAPSTCDTGKFIKKSCKYLGYHELAYLHPNHFKPDRNVVDQYIRNSKPFVILRFSNLKAHHDTGVKGIDKEIALNLIKTLNPFYQVYITSERPLSHDLEAYRIEINPLDMHHIMAHSTLFIGDSQTMAVESGVLGTPFIRFNDFVGRIGILEEIENKYKLGYGIKTNRVDELYKKVKELINTKNLSEIFQERRHKMLLEKIDVASFLGWFIENYPKSVDIMKENPDYQNRFK